jgi:hypothetical protein
MRDDASDEMVERVGEHQDPLVSASATPASAAC